MVAIVAYFSYSGRTRYEATCVAREMGAELYELREQHRRGMLRLNLLGPIQARRQNTVMIEPVAVDFSEYDRIVLCVPVWGGYPAPVFNNAIREVPQGMEISVVLTCDSGKIKTEDAIRRYAESHGVHVTDITVIKTIDLNKRDRIRRRKLLREAREAERSKKSK